MKCSYCEGKGMILFFGFGEICAECYGTGEIPDESTVCGVDRPSGKCEMRDVKGANPSE